MGNTIETQSDAKNNLKDDHVRAALKKDKGSEAFLISWGLEDFTNKGDHYIGVVTSLYVRYAIGTKENSETYIVKLGAPQSTKALRDMVTQGCKKELLFYQEVLLSLNEELCSVGLHPLRTPQCFQANQDPENAVLILTDLRSRNYKRFLGKTCLDVSHTHLVLQELARFHASSLLLETKMGRTNFDVKYNFLHKEWYNVTDDAIAFFKTLFDENVENAVAILNILEGDEKAIRWLEKIKPDVYGILEEQMKRDSVFTTVCHADCVSNNVLFRYSNNGDPVEAMLLDFQIVRRASLVTDLHLLLNISVYGSDREENLKSFLQTYYTSFKDVLQAGGQLVPFSFQELLDEYENKFLFGVLWAMSVIPMLVSGGEIADWTGAEATRDKNAATDKQTEVDSKISGRHRELRARFMPLFDALIEKRIIS